jgi:hypothetical protein
MRYIKFNDEVIEVPRNVTFWILHRSKNFETPYCVNMSNLAAVSYKAEPAIEGIIRTEVYRKEKDAQNRLDEILNLLNS